MIKYSDKNSFQNKKILVKNSYFWPIVKILISLKIHFIIISVTNNQNMWKYTEIFVKNDQFFINIRPVTAALYKKGVSKPRQWRSLESSVIVLRLRKCDKIRNFHRKKVSTPSNSESMSAIIKFLSISSQKLWKKLKVLNFSCNLIRNNH